MDKSCLVQALGLEFGSLYLHNNLDGFEGLPAVPALRKRENPLRQAGQLEQPVDETQLFWSLYVQIHTYMPAHMCMCTHTHICMHSTYINTYKKLRWY